MTVPNLTFTELRGGSMEHLRRVWHVSRERLLLRTPGSVPLGLTYVLLVETNPFPKLVVLFPDYALRTSLGTGLILLRIDFSKLFLLMEPKYFLKFFSNALVAFSFNKVFMRGDFCFVQWISPLLYNTYKTVHIAKFFFRLRTIS